ncbi:MAG: helix-turn-helix domain-containing protein, partial [Verrucomicrobia bacterium]|nr:helix-turn-helix domain-containing protein [Verrucomicrobiota bacterium]
PLHVRGELDAAPARGGALSLEANEKQMIVRALKASGGNVTKAAAELGISRRTLHRKLNEYGLRDSADGREGS